MTGPLTAEAGRHAADRAVPMSKNRYEIPLVENLVRRTLLSPGGSG